MSWNYVRLGDVCSKIGSGATPKGGATVYIDSGISLIRSQNVYNLEFSYDGLAHITEDAAEKLNGVTVLKNDVLLNITGDSVARTCIVPESVLPARVNQHVAIVRPNQEEVNPLFLNYYLASPYMQSFMLGLAVGKGASRNAMTKDMIANFEVPCPPIDIQESIVSILSAYDNLIENNQKQIKLLEEAAQRVYKEWFIDLRFPGYEYTVIVDGVPEGWKKCLLGDINCSLESGSRPKGGIDASLVDGVPSIGAENVIGLGCYNYSSEKLITKDFFSKMKRGKLCDKDILIYKDGAYIGRTSLFQDGFPHLEAAVNEHVFLLHAADEHIQYYLFFTLYQQEYYQKMQKLNKNAAQPGINSKAMMSLPVLLPTEDILDGFDSFATPLMHKIFNLAKQNRRLELARDRLLPKLMSGEIEV